MQAPRTYFYYILRIYFCVSVSSFIWYNKVYRYQVKHKNSKTQEDIRRLRLKLNINKSEIRELFYSNIGSNNYANLGGIDNQIQYSEVPDSKQVHYRYDYSEVKGINGLQNIKFGDKDVVEYNNVKDDNRTRGTLMYSRWKRIVEQQNQIYNHQVFKKVIDMGVFYISAIGIKYKLQQKTAEFKQTIDAVNINGWLEKNSRNRTLFCCFQTKGKNLTVTEVKSKSIWEIPDAKVVMATQFNCNYMDTIEDDRPVYVGVSGKTVCRDVEYVKVEPEILNKATRRNDSFAICAKVVYGDFAASRLVEWFEYNIAGGVDMISLFTYNVTKDTMKVLQHYQQTGLLHMQEFDFPLKLRYPRYLGQKYVMSYIDEQVAVYDCVQRSRHFAYIAVIDVDEFIMSNSGSKLDFKSMMKTFIKDAPEAAGFTLMTKLFVLDWNTTHPQAEFTIGQYTLSTKPMLDRPKNIILSNRVELQSIWTHGFRAKLNYTRITTSKAILYHFRRCRPHWIQSHTCHQNRNRYRDLTMKKTLTTIGKNIKKTRKLLLNF